MPDQAPSATLKLPSAEAVTALRFGAEAAAMGELLGDPQIRQAAAAALSGSEYDAERRRMLASGLRVTERIIPMLAHAVETARRIAHLDDRRVEIYVYDSPTQNASCLDLGDGRICCAFSSSIIERLNPRELLFAIGHEMGHVRFGHRELPALAVIQRTKELESGRVMKLMSWCRRAEISADRLGLACCQDLAAATTALIKVSCGLREPALQFNAEEYIAQMREIQSLSDSVEDAQDWFSTHPFNPLRVAALCHLAESKLMAGIVADAPAKTSTEELDARIEALLVSMEPGTAQAKEASAAECVLWGGFWVAACDGSVEAAERASIGRMADERAAKAADAEIAAARDPLALIKERFAQAARRCHKLPSSDRHALVQKLIVVARADTRLEEGEKAVLREICAALKVSQDFVETILRMTE